MNKHNEELYNLKESINKLENENNYLKKENKKSEELIDSNKALIDELQKKFMNQGSDSKLIEIEYKLKELTENENLDLKKKNNEKEEIINKLNDKMKLYEDNMKIYSEEINKLKKKSEEISIDEFRKKDELITYYKTQLETKEKLFNEEQQLMSSLFHQLALKYNFIKAKYSSNDSEFNWNIDKL
jgi:chromosome segregation ATPase